MKTRSEIREAAMKVLYQMMIMTDSKVDYDKKELVLELLTEDDDQEFAYQLINGVFEQLEDLKALANKYLIDWKMDRFNYVDQAIICIGLYEIKDTQTPPAVCINEAVELAKKYSDFDMQKVINGVLDKYYHTEKNNGQ